MTVRKVMVTFLLIISSVNSFSWGFYAHKRINYYAVFLLPPPLFLFYKSHIIYLSDHSVDPDKRRYAIKEEAPRHFIDMDKYGKYPFDSLPRKWNEAKMKFSEDSLQAHGIIPWWIQTMLYRLTQAFLKKDCYRSLQLSAEIAHYIADAHVPLHTSSNHNGQFTAQHGIHGFWESRVPELLAEPGWDFIIPKAKYIEDPLAYTWRKIMESALAADSVLVFEKNLNDRFRTDRKYAFESRNGVIVRQYSRDYTIAYDKILNNMVERRMRESIYSVASFWYTAWVNAGQPDLSVCIDTPFHLDKSIDTTNNLPSEDHH